MMKSTLSLSLALLVACAALASAWVPMDAPALDESVVASVNSNPSSTWVAGHNPYFAGWTVADVVRTMGVTGGAGDLPRRTATSAATPASFDWRQENAACVPSVADQGRCDSCWAVACNTAVEARMCIQGNGTLVKTAALDLVTCDKGWFSGNNGCQGGQLSSAWSYVKQTGLVTQACMEYGTASGGPIPTCAPDKQPCMPPTFVPTPSCPATCADGTPVSSAPRHHISSVYAVGPDLASIQAEISKNGPVEAAFTVYNDFVHYKSGVYKVSPGAQALGGHAVAIIGFGTANGTDYFEVQNSWTTTWGNGGFFRIGVDQAGISDNVVAGML